MPVSVNIKLNEKLFLRDPNQSELGRNIVSSAILLIDDIGFEAFTFKKLAIIIGTTEASIYRYFENKHYLLVYLICWYWAWLEYQIDFKTNNIEDPEKRLKIIIKIISESNMEDPNISYIDESVLHRIVVSEASKAYLTKNVDAENKDGFFVNYKLLCKKIAEVILEINPTYNYPRALASNLIETAHEQIFFSKHLPSLTEVKIHNGDYSEVCSFLEHLTFTALRK